MVMAHEDLEAVDLALVGQDLHGSPPDDAAVPHGAAHALIVEDEIVVAIHLERRTCIASHKVKLMASVRTMEIQVYLTVLDIDAEIERNDVRIAVGPVERHTAHVAGVDDGELLGAVGDLTVCADHAASILFVQVCHRQV